MGAAFGVEADIYGRLRSGLQVAPMVDGSYGGIDESAGKALGSFQEIALGGLFDVEGLPQDAFAELEQGGFFLRCDRWKPDVARSGRGGKPAKEADNHRLVIADDERIGLLWRGGVGGHVVGLYLLLEGNVNANVTLVLIHSSGGISLPE